MKRSIAGLFLAGLCLAQTAGEATLSGKITDAATHQPIEGAHISWRGGPGSKAAATMSDANGAYTIHVPGAQRTGLEISKTGYATLDLRSTDRTEIRLKPGDSETRDFELSKPGSLSGRLIDRDSGKALTGFYIHAIRWYEGLENSTGFRYPAAPTSGDGSFSIANLPPAGYALVVDPPMAGKITVPDAKKPDAKKPDEGGYGPTWYPNVPRPEMATPILIGYGEDRQIEMRLQKHDMLHIAGAFEIPEGMENGPVSITLATEEKGRPTGADGEIPRAGPFRIDGLEAGTYRILASMRSKDGHTAFVSRSVTLTGHSVDDLKAELRAGVTLRVSVRMAEEKADPPRRFNFLPLSSEGWGPMDDGGPPGGNSSLIRTGLPAGKYNLALMQMPGYAVASMTLNGTPLAPGALVDLESPESTVTYVLTTQLGSVAGMVRDSDQRPLADATVVVASESFANSEADFSFLPQGAGETATSDGNGRFVFNGLATGRYRVIALEGSERRWLTDTALIRDRMRTADVVVISAGQNATLDVVATK